MINTHKLTLPPSNHTSPIRRVRHGSKMLTSRRRGGGDLVLHPSSSSNISLSFYYPKLVPLGDVPKCKMAVKSSNTELFSVGAEGDGEHVGRVGVGFDEF